MYKKIKYKNTNKPLTIFLIFIFIIGLFGFSYFVYEIATQEFIKSQLNNKKYILDIYQNEYGICGDKSQICNEIGFSIETNTKESRYLTVDNEEKFILYDDNGLYIYNIEKKESKKIDLENNYLNYEICLSNKNDKVVGIIYSLENYKVGYYNIAKKSKLYEGVYDSINFLDENYLEGYNGDLEYSYLLNSTNKQEELSFKHDNNTCNFTYQLYSYNGKYYFLEKDECDTPLIKKIYDNSKNIIYEGDIESYKISFVGGFLYLITNEGVKKYDTSGNLLATDKELEQPNLLIDNYVVGIHENSLSLINFDTKEIIKITEWNASYNLDYRESKYYTRQYLDSIGEIDSLEGVYIIINYNEMDLNGNTGVKYFYNPNTKKIIETYISFD